MDVTANAPNVAEWKEPSREPLAPIGAAIEIASELEAQGIMLDVELRDRRHAIETAAAAIGRRYDADSTGGRNSLMKSLSWCLVV